MTHVSKRHLLILATCIDCSMREFILQYIFTARSTSRQTPHEKSREGQVPSHAVVQDVELVQKFYRYVKGGHEDMYSCADEDKVPLPHACGRADHCSLLCNFSRSAVL